MRVIQVAKLDEVETLLLGLGGGNQADNMNVLRQFRTFFLAELTQLEFLGLVFLQNEEVIAICPRSQDRTLRSVACRAVQLGLPALSANWNLAKIAARTNETLKSGALRSLVLRETRDSELRYGSWYIQDGSHSALGCAIALATNTAPYSPVRAYCATNSRIGPALSPSV
jgi:hypothetical protein